MKVSTEKSKIMTNSTSDTGADMSANSQMFDEVTSFRYLGAFLCKDGTWLAEIHTGITSAMAS